MDNAAVDLTLLH